MKKLLFLGATKKNLNDEAINNVLKKSELGKIFFLVHEKNDIKFFEKFKLNLSENGVIVSDNLNFHGLVQKNIDEIESRNVRGLVRKLNNYIDFLKNNKEFVTTFYEIGDGISISKKNTKKL